MRFAFRLVLILTLLWCGLHLVEPAEAHGSASEAHAWTGVAVADTDDCSSPRGGAGGQEADHHCPMAPDPGIPPRIAAPTLPAAPAYLNPTRPLASRALAPPLQPPAA